MGVGCDSLALVSIVPDCAAITQDVVDGGGRSVKIIRAWYARPPGLVTQQGTIFLEALPVFVRGRMPVCVRAVLLKQAASVCQSASQ